MSTTSRNSGRFFAALILIGLGCIFLLSNLHYVHAGRFIANWWPSILILMGLKGFLFDRRRVGPLVLVAVGVVLQLIGLDYLDWDVFGTWWPLVLIVIGLSWLVRPQIQHHRLAESAGPDRLEAMSIFSSHAPVVTSQSFQGGNATAIFGSVKIDLRGARLAESGAVLDATALMGDVVLRAPASWNVVISGSPLFGNARDTRGTRRDEFGPAGAPSFGPPLSAAGQTLQVRAEVIFGKLEIRD
jgi:predicted membrane protein